jgi:lycopene beta-cyclase
MIQHYDYIILGMGCAGFSLAYKMSKDAFFADKQILLVDQNIKATNDRTWCFWESGDGDFESCVHHKWQALRFTDGTFDTTQTPTPYEYKMIRSAKFYRHITQQLQQCKNFHWLHGTVTKVTQNDEEVQISINNKVVTAQRVFSSFLLEDPRLKEKDIYLLQHFKGYFIHTEYDTFDENVATIMDFSIDQKYGTSFCYVLPLSKQDALVEFTLFTGTELLQEQYDDELNKYIAALCGGTQFQIVEKEFGIIPMTSLKFETMQGRIAFIGTAGGATKPSTGYTWRYIQKQTTKIVQELKQGKLINVSPHARRFHLYDTTLLQLLDSQKLNGKEIFSRLYKKNTMSQLFKFLDSETSFHEELRLMSTTQIKEFCRAFLKARKILR